MTTRVPGNMTTFEGGTWYSLSSARAISLSATTVDKSSNVTIDIHLASSGVIQTTGSGGLGVYDIP